MKRLSLYLAQTGIMIAATIVLQTLSGLLIIEPLAKQIVTGSLVNLCLFIAVAVIGLWGGAVVGLATPFVALMFGLGGGNVAFVPFIAISNFLLVGSYSFVSWLIKNNKINKIIGVVVACLVKFSFLSFIFVPLIAPLFVKGGVVPPALVATFGIPQLITAGIGGLIMLLIHKQLMKIKKQQP